jgi:aminoglycoside 6-adenylyltransferase
VCCDEKTTFLAVQVNMRGEQEMLDLILGTAQEDERIRAVILNGSRANPNVQRDMFQDYDIVYVVTEMEPFVHNLEWIRRFGEMMVMQLPDEMEGEQGSLKASYAYLMQFMDGNRIDLTIFPLARLPEMERDSLSVLLLDKDGVVEPYPEPNESDYLPRPPTAKQYFECCNEFWWVSPYVAKALWRDEILYAKQLMEEVLRVQLTKCLVWYVGSKTGFAVSIGKAGKHFRRYLEPAQWELLLLSYTDADTERTWDALMAMSKLFGSTALDVGKTFEYEYPHRDEERVTAHLHRVRRLEKDAQQI